MKTRSPGDGLSELSPGALSEMLRRLREENFPWQRRQCPMARARPVPASSAPSSPASAQARAGAQVSRAAAKAAALSTPGALLREGRPRVRPLQPPPEAPRGRAAPGDRKRPSRSRFMAAAATTAWPSYSGRLGRTRLSSTPLARFRSCPSGLLGSARPLSGLLGSPRALSARRDGSLGSARARSGLPSKFCSAPLRSAGFALTRLQSSLGPA